VKLEHTSLPLSDAALAELDLLPVWRLRSSDKAQDATIAQPAEADAAKVSGVAERNAAYRTSSPASEDSRSGVLSMDWAQLKACVKDCTLCVLHERRTQSVFGVGDEQANWLPRASPSSAKPANCSTTCLRRSA
jgi:uracil-DNA glycosylase